MHNISCITIFYFNLSKTTAVKLRNFKPAQIVRTKLQANAIKLNADQNIKL